MPYRKTFPYVESDFPEKIRIQGVEYRSAKSNSKTSFYDKFLECGNRIADGLLRQEMKIYGPKNISQKLGIVDPPTLQHVTTDKVIQVLESDLDKLELKEKQLVDLNVSSQMLLKKYEYSTASHLIGHLYLRQSMSREQMIARGAKLRTLQGYDKLIADAGVTLSMTEEHVVLPPLAIEFGGAEIRMDY